MFITPSRFLLSRVPAREGVNFVIQPVFVGINSSALEEIFFQIQSNVNSIEFAANILLSKKFAQEHICTKTPRQPKQKNILTCLNLPKQTKLQILTTRPPTVITSWQNTKILIIKMPKTTHKAKQSTLNQHTTEHKKLIKILRRPSLSNSN